ncbi:MAG: response regulator transcription factor [Cytophagales bacterium]|nr:response regulator transcription factor [Cytophagales bacterium]MDW8383610.1 response regulator transcription factor [Flammeovirgaceae bacterium]
MKILYVEDDIQIITFIKKGLEENGYEVHIASDGLSGKKLALTNFYHLIILDINLPQINGFELCKIIRDENIKTPVMMLTALGSPEEIVQGLDSGADDYIVKPFRFQELLARIRALLRRVNQVAEHTTLRFADLELDLSSKAVRRGGKNINLTAKEFLLLELFMKNPNRVFSRREIIENVWHLEFDPGTNIVDVYVNYLRNKIDRGFSEKLIYTVTGMGYIMKRANE